MSRQTTRTARIGNLLLAVIALTHALTHASTSAAQSSMSISGDEPTPDDGWNDRDASAAKELGIDQLYPQPVPENASAYDEPCADCNGGGSGGGFNPFDRCGCESGYFPWHSGPGACDNWCVGPHWNVEIDGLILRRQTVDWGPVAAAVGAAPDLIDQFSYGPGARIFVTGYNDSNYGMQVGYGGVNDFHATALFPGAAGATRSFDYQSTINSLEVNFIRRAEIPLKAFAGVRYVQIDEDFTDSTSVVQTVPAPADPPTVAAFIDTSNAFLLENRMIGFQSGLFRDAWQLNRWVTIEPFGKAGVYYNAFKREELNRTRTVVKNGDDLSTPGNEYFETTSDTQYGVTRNFSELSFIGEAGVHAILRVNRCVALRGGYQIMAIDGAGEGIDAFFAPGLNGTTLVYHGLNFGLEYQR